MLAPRTSIRRAGFGLLVVAVLALPLAATHAHGSAGDDASMSSGACAACALAHAPGAHDRPAGLPGTLAVGGPVASEHGAAGHPSPVVRRQRGRAPPLRG